MRRHWRRTVLSSAAFIAAVGGSAPSSHGVYLACDIDPAAVQQYCPQWSVDCEWPIQICFDEHGQATCGFAPLDSRDYFYHGDACQLDRDGVAGGSDGDVCTRDTCNFTARHCDHVSISGCRTPTPTRVIFTPTATAAPYSTAYAACGVRGDRCHDKSVHWCMVESGCPTPSSVDEVRTCCVTDETDTQHHICDCRTTSCTLFFGNDSGCDQTRPIGPDACGLFDIPDCVACIDERQCSAGTHCVKEPGADLGTCQPEAPTPVPGSCTGDCDADGSVVVNELVLAVGIALGQGSVDTCRSADMNADGAVAVNELVAAVGAALNGC